MPLKNAPLVKRLLFSFTALILLTWLFNSCRKDQNAKQAQPSASVILAMQTEFAKLGYNASLLMPFNDTSRIQWRPHWAEAVSIKANSTTYTYIPLSAGIQLIKTGKVTSQTISTQLVRYILVETVKDKNSYMLATYQNTDTLKKGQPIDFNTFTGITYLQGLSAAQSYLVNYGKSQTVKSTHTQGAVVTTDRNAGNLDAVLVCFDTWDCTFQAFCVQSGVPTIGAAETMGYGPGGCVTPLAVITGCTPGTQSAWRVTNIKEGQMCEWVDPNNPNDPPPPLPPTCPTCTPPPPPPPTPAPPDKDPCDATKTAAAQKANTMAVGNQSISNALNATIKNAQNGNESAFRIDNVNGSFVASTPVVDAGESATGSAAGVNSNTFAVGHDHTAGNFLQPSPLDVYSAGEAAVTSGGILSMDFVSSPSAIYVLVVNNRTSFNTFLTNYPESDLEKDAGGNYTGDFDSNSQIYKDVFNATQYSISNYLSQHAINPANPTDAELEAATFAGNEAGTEFLLEHYQTGLTLLKKDPTTGNFEAVHISSTNINNITVYSSSPCNN